MLKQIFIAVLIGTAVSFAFLGLSVYADELGFGFLAKVFAWPNTFLQLLVPPHNIGTAERPFLEGSPLNDLAFVASIPFGALLYGLPAFMWLQRRTARVP